MSKWKWFDFKKKEKKIYTEKECQAKIKAKTAGLLKLYRQNVVKATGDPMETIGNTFYRAGLSLTIKGNFRARWDGKSQKKLILEVVETTEEK